MAKKRIGKKGITLVLSGGGAKGLAHIGVIEVLEKNKIPIKRIIGTSAGALVGGFYAAGKLKQIKKMFLNLSKWDVLKLFFSFPSHDCIFSCKKIDKLLEEGAKGIEIKKLKIPFTAVAFDLSHERKVLFEKGDLFEAIRSSISIPGFFKPFKLGKSLLIDGGVVDVVPVDIAKNYSKTDKILAVNLETHPILKTDKINLLKMLDYAAYIETRELARLQEKEADLIIKPNVSLGHFEFYKAEEMIKQGRKATRNLLPKIKKLLE